MNAHTRLTYFAALVMLLAGAATLRADHGGEKHLNNVDRNGLAIKGHDPVAYFTENKPVRGDATFTSTYNGATYRFKNAQNKATFDADPAKYAPQFGGYCAYAASINKLADIGPEYFSIVDGRLILQHNQKATNLWNKDVAGNLRKADGNWLGLVQKNGK